MLVDLHVSPSGRAPEVLAKAVADAGLDGAVIIEADLDRWDTYADAFEALDLVPYLGIELPLDQGTLVFVPRDLDDPALEEAWTPPGGGSWTLAGAAQRLEGLDGAIIASHPYCRDLPSVLGDAVFDLKSVTAVVTRVGQGKVAWDRQADEAAERRGAARLGSSSGLPAALGRAATILPEEADLQETLVDALEKACAYLSSSKIPRSRVIAGWSKPPRAATTTIGVAAGTTVDAATGGATEVAPARVAVTTVAPARPEVGATIAAAPAPRGRKRAPGTLSMPVIPDLGPWIPVLLTSSLLLLPIALKKRPKDKH